jgi:PKHD-type hydroxylase
MLVRVPKVLNGTELRDIRERLASATWVDGRVTAGHQSARAKANEQVQEDSDVARALGNIVLGALQRNALFTSAALPRRVFPPLFNRYRKGMGFGAHVDNAIRPIAGTPRRIRTDLSATLFLSEPSDYDGGGLVIEDHAGAQSIKLAAGDLILYPATSVHRIETVTNGERLASFFWIESMVRDTGERAILFEMDRAIVELSENESNSPAVVRLTAAYHNLVRKWADA